MSAKHPRAVGSYGAEFVAWAGERRGMHPKRTRGARWWTELVAYRALEHDAAGRLVWDTVVLSTSRQSGKSWLARELCLWRLSLAERLGEVQTVVHTAAQLKHAYSVWRPAAFWARQNGYQVRLANGEQQIAAGDGSTWMIQAANDGLGVSLSVGLGFVDEAWDVPRELVENGLAPTMAEAEQPQLWLVSTAGVPRVGVRSDLMPTYREAGLGQLGSPRNVLLLEWSAPPDGDVDDPATWRAASPHWDERRLATVEGKRVAAVSDESLAAFRLQWLNQWPEPGDVRVGSALVDAEVWDGLRAAGPPVWVSAGVESAYGLAPVVVFAGLAGGGVVVSAVQSQSTADAAGLVAGAGVRAAVGKSLLHDPAWQGVDVDPAGETTGHAVAGFRQLVDDGVLFHDGGGLLSEQVLGTSVERSAAGVRVVSSGRVDAVKAAVWAARAARTVPESPSVF